MHQHGPRHPHQFIGQCHGGDVESLGLLELQCPLQPPVRFTLGTAQGGAGAMDDQGAHVTVTALGYPEQLLFPAAGVLVRRQPEVGRNVAARRKMSGITQGRQERR